MHTSRTNRRTAGAARRTAGALAALSLAGALALTGCGMGADDSSEKSAGLRADAPQAADEAARGTERGANGSAAAPAKPGGVAKPPAVRNHVIRTATLAVEAKDAQRALGAARAAAVDAGGYVGSESTRRDEGGAMVSQVTLRVPADGFDRVLAALEGGGRLLSRKVDAQDVTQQVVDVESRVKSQQASVIRVREMMQRASALSDVVMLEGELSRRQAELEALLAQQESLKDRTSLATITLSVSEPAPAEEGAGESDPGFGDALAGGWSAFAAVVRWITLVFGAVLPFLVLAVVLLVVRRPLLRAYRKVRPARPVRAPEPVRAPGPQAGPWPPRHPQDPASGAPAAPVAPVTAGGQPAPRAGGEAAAED
ncbi:DUF4349 domain-containing protein [Streptomyces sp. NPDC002073]